MYLKIYLMSSKLLSRRFNQKISLKIETSDVKIINTNGLPSPVHRRTPPTSRKSTKSRSAESTDMSKCLSE